jgi:hypothetical protein
VEYIDGLQPVGNIARIAMQKKKCRPDILTGDKPSGKCFSITRPERNLLKTEPNVCRVSLDIAERKKTRRG